MNILKWLFRSKQVKDTLAALDELQPLFEVEAAFIWLAFDEIKRRVGEFIIENPEAVQKALLKNQPRNACLMARNGSLARI